jgi:hypothetical protein
MEGECFTAEFSLLSKVFIPDFPIVQGGQKVELTSLTTEGRILHACLEG